MINLLPPQMKEQMHYARLNRMVLRYVVAMGVATVVLAGIFAGTYYLMQLQTGNIASDIADKQKTISDLNKAFVPQAKDASDRLNAIKYVRDSQTHFSGVVADIAKVVPKGVSIDSMTLTGDDKAPVKIAVTAQSYELALALRNALTTSPRIASADLETIASDNNGKYTTSVVIAFKPGMAK